jgi:hypothetical protein
MRIAIVACGPCLLPERSQLPELFEIFQLEEITDLPLVSPDIERGNALLGCVGER